MFLAESLSLDRLSSSAIIDKSLLKKSFFVSQSSLDEGMVGTETRTLEE